MPTEVEREGEGTAALRTSERVRDPRSAPRRMAGLRSSRGLGRHGLETVAKPAKGFAECANELLLAREDGPLLFGKRLQGLDEIGSHIAPPLTDVHAGWDETTSNSRRKASRGVAALRCASPGMHGITCDGDAWDVAPRRSGLGSMRLTAARRPWYLLVDRAVARAAPRDLPDGWGSQHKNHSSSEKTAHTATAWPTRGLAGPCVVAGIESAHSVGKPRGKSPFPSRCLFWVDSR